MKLAGLIAAAAHQGRLQKKDLAARLDVSASYVGQVCSGRARPSLLALPEWAAALSCDPLVLIAAALDDLLSDAGLTEKYSIDGVNLVTSGGEAGSLVAKAIASAVSQPTSAAAKPVVKQTAAPAKRFPTDRLLTSADFLHLPPAETEEEREERRAAAIRFVEQTSMSDLRREELLLEAEIARREKQWASPAWQEREAEGIAIAERHQEELLEQALLEVVALDGEEQDLVGTAPA